MTGGLVGGGLVVLVAVASALEPRCGYDSCPQPKVDASFTAVLWSFEFEGGHAECALRPSHS
jgi:hypothetical protein